MNTAKLRVIMWYIPGKFYPNVPGSGVQGNTDGDIMASKTVEIPLQPVGSACEYCSCKYGETHRSIYVGKMDAYAEYSELAPCPNVGQVMTDNYIIQSFCISKQVDSTKGKDNG